MNRKFSRILGAFTGMLALAALTAATLELSETPSGPPEATIDLATEGGVKVVNGQWRYHDTRIVETHFRGPGLDGQPTGVPVKTYDYEPHAGGVDFDDSAWESIKPTTLDQRRANGRICFN